MPEQFNVDELTNVTLTKKEIQLILQCVYRSKVESTNFVNFLKKQMGTSVDAIEIVNQYAIKRLELVDGVVTKFENLNMGQ